MSQAGYDPNAIITFFEKLKQLGGDKNWVYFLRSHPYLDERIAASREEIKKYGHHGAMSDVHSEVPGVIAR